MDDCLLMTLQSTPATITYFRENARELINEFDAADGQTAYYTLYHNPARTTITIHRSPDGELDGFLTHCLTGIDLFRPLVLMRVRGNGRAAAELIEEALTPGRPYMFVLPDRLFDTAAESLDILHSERHHILRLEPSHYRPEMNALIVSTNDHHENPRVEARDGAKVLGAAGVNWRSTLFADIFVQVEPGSRRRGLGRSLVNALVAQLIKLKVTPLYSVAEGNEESFGLAEKVGFVDTGAREVFAHGRLQPDLLDT